MTRRFTLHYPCPAIEFAKSKADDCACKPWVFDRDSDRRAYSTVLADKFYRPAPTAAGAFVFIEVLDATYAFDRTIKIPQYMNAGVDRQQRLRQVESFESVEDLTIEHGRVFTERAARSSAAAKIAL